MNKKFLVGLGIALLTVLGLVLADWQDADFNQDGFVDSLDTQIFISAIGSNCTNSTGWCNGTDMNFDGTVNLQDVSIFAGYIGCNENSSLNSTCWD